MEDKENNEDLEEDHGTTPANDVVTLVPPTMKDVDWQKIATDFNLYYRGPYYDKKSISLTV